MSSFSDLKKSRQKSIDKINQKLQEQTEASKGFAEDTRMWKADLDKSGNGYAVIRFFLLHLMRIFSLGKNLESWFSRSWWMVH